MALELKYYFAPFAVPANVRACVEADWARVRATTSPNIGFTRLFPTET
jgi:hypothetical protein